MKRPFSQGLAVILSLVLFLLSGCGNADLSGAMNTAATESPQSSPSPQSQPQGKVYFSYFDTASYIYSYAGDSPEQFDERCKDISGILSEYHQLFDIYHEYSGISNLCTINRLAGGDPIKVDRRLVDFLLYAKNLYSLTGGKMNVMLGSVLQLWHEARTAALDNPDAARIPDRDSLQSASLHTDISLLEIDEENCTVRITDPEASIDVGALGKGYATEQAAQWLISQGISAYVLNIGGNIRIVGTKPDGSGWSTGIKDPKDPQGSFARKLCIADTSCVTSGVYERYFVVDGVRYHHIIDSETLYPSEYFASVTIVTPDSALADALSTALFCMSVEQGKKLAENIGNVEVLWITEDGGQIATAGMDALTIRE